MKQNRIQALDITRGLAVLGMIFMNYKISVQMKITETMEYSFLSSQEGRFGALFIFLAGIGISLMNRNALNNRELLKKNRTKLLKRSLFLFVLGMLFSLYWQADIFHFYAFYLLISLPLITLKSRTLWKLSVLPPIIAVLLNFAFSWETGWNWEMLNYDGFYTPAGFFRNLLFNGFHPLFPWISFLISGMAIGKSDLYSKNLQWKSLLISALIVAVTELISFVFTSKTGNSELIYLVSTAAMPAFPLYVISAVAQNILIFNAVLLCVYYFRRENPISTGLKETGKMVMTHYILHLFIGLIPLLALKKYISFQTFDILIYSLIYFAFSVSLSLLWRKWHKAGPFETLMRKFSG